MTRKNISHGHGQCKEKHDEHSTSSAEAIQEHSILIDASAADQQQIQCSHQSEEHEEENCGRHAKAKACAPAPADCCDEGCGTKAGGVCSSRRAGCAAGETRRCCRSARASRCGGGGGHASMLTMPEIVVE